MNPADTVSVIFDIGSLAEIALEQASTMQLFKGKNLKSEAVYTNNDEQYFEGIKISIDTAERKT